MPQKVGCCNHKENEMQEEKLLNAQELAVALGLSQETIYRRTREGSIPYHEIGGAYRFLLSEIIAATKREMNRKAKS